MKRILFVLVVIFGCIGNSWGQEYALDLSLKLKSRAYHIEASSYFKVTFTYQNGSTDIWTENLFGREFNNGDEWISNYSIKCSASNPITRVTIYAEHRDNPTGSGNNKYRGSNTNSLNISLSDYPCASFLLNNKLLGEYDNGSTLNIKMKPLSGVWELKESIITAQINRITIHTNVITFGNGSSQTVSSTRGQNERTYYIDENKSGIKKIGMNNTISQNHVSGEYQFNPPLFTSEASFKIIASPVECRYNIKYLKNSLFQNPESHNLPVNDRTEITTKEFHNHHQWQYSITPPDINGNQTWINFPTNINTKSGTVNFSGYELLGQDCANYVGKTIYIRVVYDCTSPVQTTYILPLTLQQSTPHILSVTPTDKICYGRSDGKLKIQLDRALLSGERLIVDYKNLTTLAIGNIPDPVMGSDNSFYLENLDAGNYEIQVSGFYNGVTTYSDGPDHKKTGKIESFPPLVYSTANKSDISCFGENNGSITIGASGGDEDYILHWRKQGEGNYTTGSFSSATQTTLSNLEPGIYEYYATDTHDCELRDTGGNIITRTETLTQPAKALEFAFLTPVLPSGYGRSDGAVTLEGDGGTPLTGNSYTATWKNKATNQPVATVENDPSGTKFRTTAKNIPTGTYTVEIKDANNCTFTDEIIIGQPEELVATIENTLPILCNSDTNGELVVHARGGVLESGQQYTYLWYKKNGTSYQPLSSYTDSIASGLGKGDYKVDVIDRSRIVNTLGRESALTEPAALATTLSKQDVTCYGGNNGSIRIGVSGGVGDYKLYYKLKDDTGYNPPLSPQGNLFLLDNLVSGEYRLYITDGNDCIAPIAGESVAAVTISQPMQALGISNAIIKPVSGFGRSDGSITIKIQGGTPNSSAPFYTVIWKDADGNSVTSNDAADAYGVFTSKIENLADGTYTVEVKDKNYVGIENTCYILSTFTMTEPKPLTVEQENSNGIYCYGEETGELIAHAKGGVPKTSSGLPYTYKWYKIGNGNGNAVLMTNQTDSIVGNLPVGFYKVRIEDSSNPVNVVESAVFEITQPVLLATMLTTRDISCYGLNDGSIRIAVSGGVGNYKLFGKKERDANYREYPIEPDHQTFVLDNLPSGKYTVYIQDGNNCYAKINGEDFPEITLAQPAAPLAISGMSKVDASGFGRSDGNIKITVEGGTPNTDNSYNIVWKNTAGDVLSSVDSLENGKYTSLLNNIPKGSYTAEVKDKNHAGAYPVANASCIVSELYSILEPDELLAQVEETHFISCNGMSDGQLIAHAKGGIRNPVAGRLPYKYKWYKEEASNVYNLLTEERDSVLSFIAVGKYKVEIEDYSRLVNTISIGYDLGQPASLQATATNTSITCGQTANISVDVTGGTAPYSYEWSTGDKTQSIANAGSGRYFVFVTDSRGCRTTAIATVSTPSDLLVEGTASNPVCYRASNGSITLQVTGGTAPYSYIWNTGATSKDLSNLKAGLYTVIVSDKDGCAYTGNFALSDPEPLDVSLGEDRTLCNGQSLTLAPAVADPNTRFDWTGPDAFHVASPAVILNKAGTYRLTITDSKGCQASDEIKIDVRNVEISSEIFVSTEVFAGDTVVIANISNPSPDSVEWLIVDTDSLRVVEMDEYYARVAFIHPGYYTVGFRAHKGDCFQEIHKTITVTNPEVARDDPFGESIIDKFFAYPNPNDGNFNIKVGLNKASAIRLRIINIGTGHIVSDKKYNGREEYDIPYNMVIPAGIYVVALETASGYMNIKMIIR